MFFPFWYQNFWFVFWIQKECRCEREARNFIRQIAFLFLQWKAKCRCKYVNMALRVIKPKLVCKFCLYASVLWLSYFQNLLRWRGAASRIFMTMSSLLARLHSIMLRTKPFCSVFASRKERGQTKARLLSCLPQENLKIIELLLD